VTPLRISKTRARLADGFTAPQLMTVIERILADPWYRGQNDRKWSCPGPEWAIHSVERVEQWLRKQETKVETYADQVRSHFGKS
jgi:hypothetical protein